MPGGRTFWRKVKRALLVGAASGLVGGGVAAILFPPAGVPFLLAVGGSAASGALGQCAGDLVDWAIGEKP
ncbi:MAG: hypothetical protein QOJ94_3046 [Sphingomonadales bacterium]|jgi:hypothetical protein|nr:hypothetical protein [Sphingomonadales bacterium]